MRAASRVLFAAGIVSLALVPAGSAVQARTGRAVALQPVTSGVFASAASRQLMASIDALTTRSPMALTAGVAALVDASGGSAGVSLIELGGSSPMTWSYHGEDVFIAASTYKLAVLMMEAQGIAAGATDPNGLVCFEDGDYEDGWFADYTDGACYTRTELARRAGLYSDNTAGHMLVRDVGGADALNAWAASAGASESVFYTDNTTSASDLSVLWTAEAKGSLGGAAAQAWLYPLLTGTATEAGIPAGVAGRSAVVHKTGTIDLVEDDAALVTSGPNGPYVLTVMTDGLGGDAGWQLISAISATVWSFEAVRS